MKISALDIYLPTTYIFCILLCPIDQNYVKILINNLKSLIGYYRFIFNFYLRSLYFSKK